MSLDKAKEKTIRVIPFDGSKSQWGVWEEKFLARAKRRGYKKLLLGEEKAPTATESQASTRQPTQGRSFYDSRTRMRWRTRI